jgi:hypothetical protein
MHDDRDSMTPGKEQVSSSFRLTGTTQTKTNLISRILTSGSYGGDKEYRLRRLKTLST